MALISLEKVSLAYGIAPLLDEADFSVDAGERVCLLGRNGAGKSTLLRVLSGELQPDAGEVRRRAALRIARLEQDVPAAQERSVFDVVADGLGELGAQVRAYHATAAELAREPAREELLVRLEALQHDLEAADGWRLTQQVERVLSRLDLDGDARMGELSGGWARRALLARALVGDPELLLLDEPTNHLDIAMIGWLEDFLLGYRGALVFITHDRALVRRLATRIVELDRGRLTSWPGDYAKYEALRDERLEVEQAQAAEFDKHLAQEETWVRQGIKARRTRNEGRVRRLEALRAARAARRELLGKAKIELDAGGLSGKLVIEAEGLTKTYDGKPVVKGLDLRVLRGDRIGLIGPNGAGKTTLLRLLLGELAPDAGSVRHGTRLEVAYFDQQRAALDPAATVLDTVAEGRDQITVNGRTRHVISYLRDFLFQPERARAPVSALSGGERARLLLARLFTAPANMLVMDEPTNDLDMETLELLESLLADYPGTLLLVSHDREFLDNVVNSTLVFEGGGVVREYVGGYSDWLRQRPAEPRATEKPAATAAAKPEVQAKPAPTRSKLSYKDQRELDALPERIAALEEELAELEGQLADPALYQRPDAGEAAAALAQRAETVRAEVEHAYARWAELDG
ncbi:ATP-binding cassette domain-containing protein [Ectothiorhodospiraceae bacterium 2226]|nr:ATP-binding cassette domain-containing protein [Ectothiorhodospiraceae bacterium 2226]